jgi:hypothetical protein
LKHAHERDGTLGVGVGGDVIAKVGVSQGEKAVGADLFGAVESTGEEGEGGLGQFKAWVWSLL